MQFLSDYYPLRPTGNIATVEECRIFANFVKTLHVEGKNCLLFDLADVEEVSGSLSGFLTECVSIIMKSGGQVLITNASPAITEVLKLTGFEDRLCEQVSAPVRNDRRALLVEDDHGVRDLTHRYLDELGFLVIESPDGADGAARFQLLRHHIDLVVSDIEMPVLDGLDFLRKVHGLNPAARVVMATGYTHSDKIQQIRDIRDIPILRKPYMLDDFAKAVHSVFSPSV